MATRACREHNYTGTLIEVLAKKRYNTKDLHKEIQSSNKNGKKFVFEIKFDYENQSFCARGVGENKKAAKSSASKNVLIKLIKYLKTINPISYKLEEFGLTESDLSESAYKEREDNLNPFENTSSSGSNDSLSESLNKLSTKQNSVKDNLNRSEKSIEKHRQLYARAPIENYNGFMSRPVLKLNDFQIKKQINSNSLNGTNEIKNEDNEINNNEKRIQNGDELKINEEINKQDETKSELNKCENLTDLIEKDHQCSDEMNESNEQNNFEIQNENKELNGDDENKLVNTNQDQSNLLKLPTDYLKRIFEMNLIQMKEEFLIFKKMCAKDQDEDKNSKTKEEDEISKTKDENSKTKVEDENSSKEMNQNDEPIENSSDQLANRAISIKKSTKLKKNEFNDLEKIKNAIEYLNNNYEIFRKLFKTHDENRTGVCYSDLIEDLEKSLPELKYSYFNSDDQFAISRIFYKNQCLFTVFNPLDSLDSAIEKCARKMFFAIKLQLQRRE